MGQDVRIDKRMICLCTSGTGAFHLREDGLWSHVTCDLPTQRYLEVFMAKKDQERGQAIHLNALEGGPLDGVLLTTAEMVDRVGLIAHANGEKINANLHDYRWTNGTSLTETGCTARVWTYKHG